MERKDLPLIGPPGRNAAPPPPNPLSLKGDAGRADSKPARTSEPTARLVLPPDLPAEAPVEADDAVIAQLRKIEEVVRDAKKAKADRDEARTKAARLEHELGQAREQLDAAQESATQVEELTAKLEEAEKGRDAAVRESSALKARVGDLEGQLKKSDERLKAAEEKIKGAEERAKSADEQVKKQTNALVNAKDARDEATHKLESAMALLQGRPLPPKPEKKL